MKTAATVAGFPITGDVTLRKRGEHNGLTYEVSNHGRDSDYRADGTYCYYVTVSERQLPAELFAEFWLEPVTNLSSNGMKRISYDYFAARFANVEWHGGVTFYEKLGGLDGDARYVKIGCDFAHYWDEGRGFHLEQVEREAKATIDELCAMYPFRRRCPYFGTYHDVSEMVPHPVSGALFSAAGIEKMLEPA